MVVKLSWEGTQYCIEGGVISNVVGHLLCSVMVNSVSQTSWSEKKDGLEEG